MVLGQEGKGLCAICHKFYDLADGHLVEELKHITVASVDEKGKCYSCELEREAWPRG